MGWTHILDKQVGLETYAGPGHWNDPDMLEVGNGGMSLTEYRAHFSLWCLLSAPLMAGNDIRNMSSETVEILTNEEVIAVNQDTLGKQGTRVKDKGDHEVWSKHMSDGSRAVVLFNRSKEKAEITVNWTDIGYPVNLSAKVRDLWKHRDMGSYTGQYSAAVPAHGVIMVRITP